MILRYIENGIERTATLPCCFTELTEEQFCNAARYACGNIDEQKLLRSLLGNDFKKINFKLWMMLAIREHLSFIHELKEQVPRFFIKKIRVLPWKHAFFAPKDHLEGVSFVQFMSIDNFFSFYCANKKTEMLCKMVACIYTPKNKKFVCRQKGDKLIDIPNNAALIQKYISEETIFSVFINWILVKNWLTSLFPHLFVCSAAEDESPGVRRKNVADWLNIFDTFVGENIADMESYQAMECMDAFRILNNKIKQSKQYEHQ